MRRRSASGVHVDELDLIGAAHHGVGHRLALGDAGDAGHDVVERLQVLDVERGDDVDPRLEQLLDVLPPLLVTSARAFVVGVLVDEHDVGRRARTASRSMSVNTTPRCSTSRRGTISSSPSCSMVRDDRASRPHRSPRPRPRSARRRPSASMAKVFPRPGEAPRWMRSVPRAIASLVSLSAPTRRAPGSVRARRLPARRARPSTRPTVCSSTSAATSSTLRPPPAATRGVCRRALATEMCGSRPDPDAVTASTGTATSGGRSFSAR